MNNNFEYYGQGIADKYFIRGKVPMTKEEVRAITMSKLQLKKGMTFLDIGAGTGSISIEAAFLGAKVFSVEKKPEGIDLIYKNKAHFSKENIEVIEGIAPECLDNFGASRFDRIFIGGSGGNLKGIFDYMDTFLINNGIVVANTITLENTGKILELLKEHKYKDIEIVQISVSKNKSVANLNMMIAENPITLLKGIKE